MRRILSVTMLVCILLAFAVVVFADDREPPPWQRQGPRTTFQRWEFSTPVIPPEVDPGAFIPYGPSQFTVVPGPGMQWMNFYDNRQGVWPLSGLMEIVVQNAPDHPDWTKKIWLQLTWEQEGPILPVLMVDGHLGQLIEQDSVGGIDPAHPWYHTTWLFTLPYNPPFEIITIAGDIMVDELVIDTICAVPEPSSMLAILTSVIGLAGFAWKKRS
jgi:hypothetical protein